MIGEIYGEPYILGVNSASIGIEPKRECHLLSVVMDANYFGSWIEKNKNTVESTNWFSRWISGNKILSD
ncbi:hypothetical protein K2X05_01795 [bacterium]|nr:hypothetical protein [bacterium]